MSQVPSYRSATNPELEAARARERLRSLSGKAHAGRFPLFTLAAILLACLLMYLNIGRNDDPITVGRPACDAAAQGHACK